jgi:hypothetical protein
VVVFSLIDFSYLERLAFLLLVVNYLEGPPFSYCQGWLLFIIDARYLESWLSSSSSSTT